MKLLAFAASMLVVCSLKKDAFSQTIDVVTYTSAENQRLQCDISGSGAVQWIDQTELPAVAIISYIPSSGDETVESTDDKYDDFTFEATGNFYDLIIGVVDKDEEGLYACVVTPGGVAATYRVIAEVPPESISLSCSSCTDADSSCDCQCSASGGSSPSLLRLEWKINDIALANQPPTGNSTNSGQTIYSSIAVVSVNQDNSVVTCTLTGFENQDEIESRFTSRVVAEQTLSSPICIVSVNSDNCPTVVLSCSCEAYPSVPDGPEHMSYYARQGPEDIGNDTLLSSPSYEVTPGSDTYFLCSGDNGLNFGRKSEAVPNPCEEAQPTEPPATTRKNGKDPDDPGQSPRLGIIIPVAIVAVIIILVVIIVILLKFGIINRENGKGGSNDNTDGNGVNAKLAAEQPEYAAVNKPTSQPQAAPRSSQPPDKEEVELQYADLDHGKQGAPKEVRQPANEPTEYATVQSVIV